MTKFMEQQLTHKIWEMFGDNFSRDEKNSLIRKFAELQEIVKYDEDLKDYYFKEESLVALGLSEQVLKDILVEMILGGFR